MSLRVSVRISRSRTISSMTRSWPSSSAERGDDLLGAPVAELRVEAGARREAPTGGPVPDLDRLEERAEVVADARAALSRVRNTLAGAEPLRSAGQRQPHPPPRPARSGSPPRRRRPRAPARRARRPRGPSSSSPGASRRSAPRGRAMPATGRTGSRPSARPRPPSRPPAAPRTRPVPSASTPAAARQRQSRRLQRRLPRLVQLASREPGSIRTAREREPPSLTRLEDRRGAGSGTGSTSGSLPHDGRPRPSRIDPDGGADGGRDRRRDGRPPTAPFLQPAVDGAPPRFVPLSPRVAVLLVAAAVLGLLLWMARDSVRPFIIGLLLVYLLDGPVHRLSRAGIRRPFAI